MLISSDGAGGCSDKDGVIWSSYRQRMFIDQWVAFGTDNS